MERYENYSDEGMSRVKRNQAIYSSSDMSELSRIKTNNNVSVISDAPKEIDLEKIKNYVYSINENTEEKQRRVSLELPEEEEIVVNRLEEKEYDINSFLEKAKDKREIDYEEERHRKINNTQIDILKNIKIKEEIREKEEEDLTGPIDELNTEEKTIVDLIQNIQTHAKKKDLFEDLMGDDEDTVVMAPIDEEINSENLKDELFNITQDIESLKEMENSFTREINIEKDKLKESLDALDTEEDLEESEELAKTDEVDNSFYTNSVSFNKSDFEGFEELDDKDNKGKVFTRIAIVLIILMLLATIFLILNFTLNWHII